MTAAREAPEDHPARRADRAVIAVIGSVARATSPLSAEQRTDLAFASEPARLAEAHGDLDRLNAFVDT